jgi:hypothetical protein
VDMWQDGGVVSLYSSSSASLTQCCITNNTVLNCLHASSPICAFLFSKYASNAWLQAEVGAGAFSVDSGATVVLVESTMGPNGQVPSAFCTWEFSISLFLRMLHIPRRILKLASAALVSLEQGHILPERFCAIELIEH